MNRKIAIALVVVAVIIVYYGLQYGSSAVHYNCEVLKDDCPPPIYLAAEVIYRILVQPPWLDQFGARPTIYSFKDGEFSLWQGNVDGKIVIIRVGEEDSPVLRWIFEENLPRGIAISPASRENVKQWLKDHPEYELEN